jgi:adenine C2-methylase RlmN of 23S rRNA A2503 and tRNA A37
MGKLRSLTSDEIIVQLYYANQIVRLLHNDATNDSDTNDKPTPEQLPSIDNIVFMGMVS